MKFVPTKNHYLIKEAERPTSIGKIALPDNVKIWSTSGKVIATYKAYTENGVKRSPVCEVGDTIYFSPHNAIDITLDSGKFAVIAEDNLLAREGK